MVELNIPYGEKMKNMLKKVREGYKYLSAQDIPLWRNLLFILKYPKIVYRFIFVKNSGSDFLEQQPVDPSDLCRDVSRAIGIDEGELWEYHKEFESDSRYHQSIEKKLQLTSERANKTPEYGWREFLYLVVRAVKPKIMIETGSFDGLSTAIILLGMDKNDRGTLFTIDLPNPRLPSDIDAEPAWLVPDYLRDRLELKMGKSSEYLESVIGQVGGLDMFYHDSWHTYENMMFEYQTVWSALCPGGLLMSEYTDRNDAIKDFTKDKENEPVIIANSQFILRKSFCSYEDCSEVRMVIK